MEQKKKFRGRQHLRAPVYDDVLYECDNYVLSGRCMNISEGGLLLSELGLVPESKEFKVILPLTQYPDFAKLSVGRILMLERNHVEKEIIKIQVKVERSFEGMSDVQKILLTSIGVSFKKLEHFEREFVKAYVETYTKNIVYLLSLFENNDRKKSNNALIRKVASLLGYDSELKISLLRLKILHDYQSLESP